MVIAKPFFEDHAISKQMTTIIFLWPQEMMSIKLWEMFIFAMTAEDDDHVSIIGGGIQGFVSQGRQ